jgi:hypothetical protein
MTAMRASAWLLGVGLLAGLGAAPLRAAGDQPAIGTDRFAQPAQPAPLEGSPKRFIKAEPARAPRLSAPIPEAGPVIPPLPLKGHRDVPPSTTSPLKAERAHGTPPSGD